MILREVGSLVCFNSLFSCPQPVASYQNQDSSPGSETTASLPKGSSHCRSYKWANKQLNSSIILLIRRETLLIFNLDFSVFFLWISEYISVSEMRLYHTELFCNLLLSLSNRYRVYLNVINDLRAATKTALLFKLIITTKNKLLEGSSDVNLECVLHSRHPAEHLSW